MFTIKKLLLFVGLLSLPLLLSACSQTFSNHVSSNGIVLFYYNVNMHDHAEGFDNMTEEERKAAGLEGMSKEEYLEMMKAFGKEEGVAYEFCEEEDEDNEVPGYETLYSLCIENGMEMEYYRILYNGDSVTNSDSFYEYSLQTLLDSLEIGLEPREGDELIEGAVYELSFDGDIVYSDLDGYEGNKVSFSLQDLRQAFEGNNNPIVRAKKNVANQAISFSNDDFTDQFKYEIKNNGDLHISQVLMNEKVFNTMKNVWDYSDDDFAKIPFCEDFYSEEKDFCGVSGNSIIRSSVIPKEEDIINYIEGSDFRQYNLANLILMSSDFDDDDIKEAAEFIAEENIEFVLIFENDILSADFGSIQGKTLFLKAQDVASINQNSIIKVSSSSAPGDNTVKVNNNENADLKADKINIVNKGMYGNLKGKILLQTESKGEAYYVSPTSQEMYFLGRPEDAFAVMRGQGIGISNFDLAKIPIALENLSGLDSDGDGLPDALEAAIGTNPNNPDSDGDTYSDYEEIVNGYNPLGAGRLNYDENFAKQHRGKIFLQVERNGEAWYISPDNSKRYFLGRPHDAFSVMRNLSLGISNNNLDKLKK